MIGPNLDRMTDEKNSPPGKAAFILKQLREEAGHSVRSFAKALDMPWPSYQYYETRFKKDHLPFQLFALVREQLMARNIAEDRIDELLPEFVSSKFAAVNAQLSEIKEMLKGLADHSGGPNGHAPQVKPPRGKRRGHRAKSIPKASD